MNNNKNKDTESIIKDMMFVWFDDAKSDGAFMRKNNEMADPCNPNHYAQEFVQSRENEIESEELYHGNEFTVFVSDMNTQNTHKVIVEAESVIQFRSISCVETNEWGDEK